MRRQAFGIVETRGLIGAIEAADAMVKASNVTLIGRERVDPALISVKITGDVAAVKASVEAGAQAASRVGQLVSVHIIPQPDEQLKVILPELDDNPEIIPVDVTEDIVPDEQATVEKTPAPEEPEAEPLKETPPIIPPVIEKKKEKQVKTKEAGASLFEDNDTIARLKREALSGTRHTKTEIPDNKNTDDAALQALKDNINNLQYADVESLNVHQLRHIARSIQNFPIQGRMISKSNKTELLNHFRQVLE